MSKIFTLTVDLDAMDLPHPYAELADILKRVASKMVDVSTGPRPSTQTVEEDVHTMHGDMSRPGSCSGSAAPSIT